MKKILCLILSLTLLISLFGCDLREKKDEVPVSFFYLRDPDNYVYGSGDGVVTYELRDATEHAGDLKYLLTLYLQGPLDEKLRSPYPAGCKLLELHQDAEEITLLLNSNLATLKDMDLTLACVCLARTCFSLANVRSVRIMVESFADQIAIDQTIHIDSLLPLDTAIPTESGK